MAAKKAGIISRQTFIKGGISFGSALAMVISFTTNKSVLWAIFHGLLGWVYIAYFVIVHRLLG